MDLEPGLAKALEPMTSRLMTAINARADPPAETVLCHINGLKRARDRPGEGEARTLQLETTNEPQATTMLSSLSQTTSTNTGRKRKLHTYTVLNCNPGLYC